MVDNAILKFAKEQLKRIEIKEAPKLFEEQAVAEMLDSFSTAINGNVMREFIKHLARIKEKLNQKYQKATYIKAHMITKCEDLMNQDAKGELGKRLK